MCGIPYYGCRRAGRLRRRTKKKTVCVAQSSPYDVCLPALGAGCSPRVTQVHRKSEIAANFFEENRG